MEEAVVVAVMVLFPHSVEPHLQKYLLQDRGCCYPHHVSAPSAYVNDKQSLGVAINGRNV
jgi:hypothetical protein